MFENNALPLQPIWNNNCKNYNNKYDYFIWSNYPLKKIDYETSKH